MRSGITARPEGHRFSVADFYRMGEIGILGKRTELIKGIITDMEPIGPWHADIVSSLQAMFGQQAGGHYAVRVQQPIDLGSESQPQPDVVLCRAGRRYRERHPGPADVFLVIEVADTTLDFDLADKRALYAEAGIAEYWVIGVAAKKLTRFVQGGVEQPISGARISPATFPEVIIDLEELLG